MKELIDRLGEGGILFFFVGPQCEHTDCCPNYDPESCYDPSLCELSQRHDEAGSQRARSSKNYMI